MGIFVVQGAMVGVMGTLAGLLMGLGVAFNIDVIVPALEQAAGCQFPAQRHLPDQPHAQRPPAGRYPAGCGDRTWCWRLSATLYPSWRASRVNPAEALRYE
jgi:lipoprotein-releasing system permease protein